MGAHALLERAQGSRPVTLVGTSLGSLVIFEALTHMATRKHHVGIIQDVYLFGAPVSGAADDWKPITPLIAGKIVNCLSSQDGVIKLCVKGLGVKIGQAVAGLDGICSERAQNLDMTATIKRHGD